MSESGSFDDAFPAGGGSPGGGSVPGRGCTRMVIVTFGRENVYVELQRHLNREQEARNQALVELACSLKLPLIATNGVSHPEPPYIVRHSTETLVAGDVVTLEPGLYVDGVGGIRIEHNYLITEAGFDRLSDHVISLH